MQHVGVLNYNERAAVAALLADPAVRLLTLVGAGGSGKTRLALQIGWDLAAQFADGALFVGLAPLRDPALVLQAIGLACGLAQPSPATLTQYLRDKQLLLVLDNCEHLLDAAPRIAELLDSAPGLRVLATSRAALNVRGEHTFPVPPLPLPDLSPLPSLAGLADVPAVALLARTRALNPSFGSAPTTPPISRRSTCGSMGCHWHSSWLPRDSSYWRPAICYAAWTIGWPC